MPYKAPRPCRRGGCPELVTDQSGFCEKHRAEEHARYNREQRPDFHKMYSSPRWTRMSRAYLDAHMFCEKCGRFAELTHHRVPHGGDPALFYDEANLEALCRSCHEYEHRRGATR